MSSFRSRLGDDNFFDEPSHLDSSDDRFDAKLENLLRRRPELAQFYRDRPRTRTDLSDFPSLRGFFSSKFDDGQPGGRSTHANFPSFSRNRPHREEQNSSQSSAQNATQSSAENAREPPPPPKGLPQYNLRNTVDLGRKLAESSDEVDKNKRSMSAPPDGRGVPAQADNRRSAGAPSANNARKQPEPTDDGRPVERIIPITVEGRDEPLVNNFDIGGNYAETRHVHRDEDDNFGMNHDPSFQQHFGESFGAPRNHPGIFRGEFPGPGGKFQKHSKYSQEHEQPHQKNFQEKPQQRPTRQFQEQHFKPKREESPQHNRGGGGAHKIEVDSDEQHAVDGHVPQAEFVSNDPIKKILLIQNDVLALMTQVENFSGKTKRDKEYVYLDEMLTRNLLKLDVIDTEGKENIRLARKEAIKCIQQCIAVLENKAEQASRAGTDAADEMCSKKQVPESNIENKPMEQNMENVETSTKAILVNNVNMDVDEQNSNKNDEGPNKCDSKTNTSSAMETDSSETK